MQQFINKNTLEEVTFVQLKGRFPLTLFPDGFAEDFEDYAPVQQVDQPAHDPATHKVVRAPAVEVDGVWQQQWDVVPLTQQELDAIAAEAAQRRDAAMQAARTAIEQWRDAQERASMVFQHAGRSWDGGLAVRARMQPLVALGAVPAGFFWTDADNNDVPTDFAALQALNLAHEQALVAQGFAIHQRQRAMKEALPTMTDEQLQAFVPGWVAEGVL